jgi:hypothetical protein
MKPRSYAQRLLNPFRGVMNIIEYQGAEAVTTDGINWDIYVRDNELVEDMANSSRVQTSDIRYGSWSRNNGLKRGAIYPSDDFKVLEHRGAIVYEHLLKHHQEVPFPLEDNIELWLLDRDGKPLGLIDSVTREEEVYLDGHIDWRAGLECRGHFRPSVMPELLDSGDAGTSAGAYLTGYINARAGEPAQAQWVHRNPDGTGTGLAGINLAGQLRHRALEAGDFPTYFLSEDDTGPLHRQLIRDFLAWQAPCLLLLQDLSVETRRRFERLARSRTLAVEKHFRLYPEVVDSEALTAARVEAALRRNQQQEKEQDETMATYYIELNVTRTN